jgi:hypothetical protein
MLRAMQAEGLDLDACIRVLEAGETRSSGAERQSRYRARKAERNDSDVTGDVTPSPNERDNLTPTRERKTEAKASSKKRRAIPDDWQPLEFSEGSESRKVVDSWPPGERPAQVEQFKAHHRSKRNTFIDPQDAWSTWVLNTRKWGIGRHERSSNPTGDALARVQAAIRSGSSFG